MKLVFCGTPTFAVSTLEAVLAAGHEIALVVTQPDRPVGRHRKVDPGSVKVAALRHNLPVLQPDKIKNNNDFRRLLEGIEPEAIVVVAYGRIIPDWMLTLPKWGCINLHGSLLPKYRGAAPVQWAIANGEIQTGVTTMLLEAGLDTGPVFLAKERGIGAQETSENVLESLAHIGAQLMVETLAGLEAGTLQPIPQDHAQATLAPLLTREDGLIDFTLTAETIHDRWRGFQPWPGVWSTLRGKKLIMQALRACDLAGVPSQLRADGSRLFVGCGGESSLELLEVQLEGKKRMFASEFLRGAQIGKQERLGA